MRTTFKKLQSGLFILSILFLFASCSKDKSTDTSGVNTLTATIKYGGQTITFNGNGDSSVVTYGTIRSMGQTYFSMIGNERNSQKQILFMMSPFSGKAGNYDLSVGLTDDSLAMGVIYMKGENNGTEKDAFGTYLETNAGDVIRGSGFLHITSLANNRIEGTFEMILHNYDENSGVSEEMTVSEGRISLPAIKADVD